MYNIYLATFKYSNILSVRLSREKIHRKKRKLLYQSRFLVASKKFPRRILGGSENQWENLRTRLRKSAKIKNH